MQVINGEGQPNQEWDEANLFLLRQQALHFHARTRVVKAIDSLLTIIVLTIGLCAPAVIWYVYGALVR